MSTTEQRQKLIDDLKVRLAELASIEPQSLARTSDLAKDINFEDAVPSFEEMLELCKQLDQRDISRLTTVQLNGITKAIKTLETMISKVQGFSLKTSDPSPACQAIITEVENAYDIIMEPLLLPLAFTATQSTDYSKIEREAKGHQTTMQGLAEDFQNYITKTRTEAQKALEAVREQAAEAGVSTTAQTFEKQAKLHAGMAKNWAKGTIVMSSVTLLSAIGGLAAAIMYHPEGTSATIQFVVAKLIILSTLSYGILWCARNYRAQKHNETLNRHRANALKTFLAFVEGTSDNRVKDSILLQASQAAFLVNSTGFDGSDKAPQSISPVLEVIGKRMSPGDGEA